MTESENKLRVLASRRWRIALWLTAGMLAIYAGFILLIAFNKAALGAILVPGLSWGIVLGVLVILSAWVLTGVYVLWANRHYDAQLHALRDGGKQP